MTGLPLALLVAALSVAGLGIERLLVARRVEAYFTAGFPLLPELVPLPKMPHAEAGRTAILQWERHEDLVQFWVPSGNKEGPMGLHGAVRLWPGPRGVRMVVRWSPPWSPIVAFTWLGVLGVARNELYVVPVAVLLVGMMLYVYRTVSIRAAAELRWALIRDYEGGDETNSMEPPGKK